MFAGAARSGPYDLPAMDTEDGGRERGLTRRVLIKRGLLAGGVIAGGGAAVRAVTGATGEAQPAPDAGQRPPRRIPPIAPARPNILVLLVDQLRFPQWLSAPGL